MAYQLSATRGSEYSVGWNFVNEIAARHKVYVLCGASGDHMGDLDEIEGYCRESANPNIVFVPVTPNRVARFLNYFNKIGFWPAFYLAFSIWHKQAFRVALKLQDSVDLVHQLGPIGYREPGYLWKLDRPFVWGPIGGTVNKNIDLMTELKPSARWKFIVKNIINSAQFRYSSRVRKVFTRADALLASTKSDAANISRVYQRDCSYLTENGIFSVNLRKEKFVDLGTIRLVWSGSHVARKNLRMLLDALALMQFANKVHLDIVGSGQETDSLKKHASDTELAANIVWHGHVSRDKSIEIMSSSHLHVMTSLLEANSTVLFEAMSNGVPTISLDHCGMKDVICEKCGIKIPPNNYHDATQALAMELDRLVQTPECLIDLAHGVLECSTAYQWPARMELLDRVYAEAAVHFSRQRVVQ